MGGTVSDDEDAVLVERVVEKRHVRALDFAAGKDVTIPVETERGEYRLIVVCASGDSNFGKPLTIPAYQVLEPSTVRATTSTPGVRSPRAADDNSALWLPAGAVVVVIAALGVLTARRRRKNEHQGGGSPGISR